MVWVLPPLCNRWIICIIHLYIPFYMTLTLNLDCKKVVYCGTCPNTGLQLTTGLHGYGIGYFK